MFLLLGLTVACFRGLRLRLAGSTTLGAFMIHTSLFGPGLGQFAGWIDDRFGGAVDAVASAGFPRLLDVAGALLLMHTAGPLVHWLFVTKQMQFLSWVYVALLPCRAACGRQCSCCGPLRERIGSALQRAAQQVSGKSADAEERQPLLGADGVLRPKKQ